jgi:tRNA-2-methylthio-N6-dimethylallyladenosine synthase
MIMKIKNQKSKIENHHRFLYIHTIGCQMNVYDSGQIENMLRPQGYLPTPFPETADVIIINTCAIREKAEQKVFSFLGRLSELKRKKPHIILGVGGCVAQQEGRKILVRMPHVDLVFGTRAISRLPSIIEQVKQTHCRIVDIDMALEQEEKGPEKVFMEGDHTTRFVTIMRGCDNFCAYCVVPYVRGRETSRHPDHILKEIRNLVDAGVREVTLLGQNVNSYGKKEGLCTFSELLARVNNIKDLSRIRFTTSHPKDLSDDLIYAFRDLDKLCNHIHLPIQSGSDRILKRMNRKYTRSEYFNKIEKFRSVCPDIAVTTDIIVGFPGETEADFGETLDLIKSVEYDSLFAFKYSDRPIAPAARFSDKISESEKKDRLSRVLEVQKHITGRCNSALLGSIQTVLVDGYSKRNGKLNSVQWSGRTPANKIVNFTENDTDKAPGENLIGRMVSVRIDTALTHSLRGQSITGGLPFRGSKGVDDYAA